MGCFSVSGRGAAGIPEHTAFATTPELAWRMAERAVAARVPFGWFAGDEVYGDYGPLRTRLEEARIRCVLAVSCDHRIPAGAGRTLRADRLVARLPKRGMPILTSCDCTQLPSVPSTMPRSRAISATGRLELTTSSTASSLYSWVYFLRA